MLFLYAYTDDEGIPVPIDETFRSRVLAAPNDFERVKLVKEAFNEVSVYEDVPWDDVMYVDMEVEEEPDPDDPATMRVYTRK